MTDLNDVDSVEQISNVNDIHNDHDFINADELDVYNDRISTQYIKLENLGTNKIESIDNDQIKHVIFKEFIWYVHNNYFPVPNYEDVYISAIKCFEMGNLLYNFIIIDLYNSILPNFLSINKITSIKDFDDYINKVLKNNLELFKQEFIESINGTISRLKNVENLDKELIENVEFQNLIKKLISYSQLINFGDFAQFHEFLRLYIIINEQELYTKSL